MKKNNLVRDMRLYRCMTIDEFAKSVGVSKSTITRAELGHITLELKAKVLRVYPLDDAFFSYLEQQKRAESYY